MGETMEFPETVEEFMEEYKIVDTKQVYTNGSELVPIFRMKQWFEAHERFGEWEGFDGKTCSACKLPWDKYLQDNANDWGYFDPMPDYCPNCGARMGLHRKLKIGCEKD